MNRENTKRREGVAILAVCLLAGSAATAQRGTRRRPTAPAPAAKKPAAPVVPAAARGGKTCPRCKRVYGPALNFCEVDGTRLQAPAMPPTQLTATPEPGAQVRLSWKDPNTQPLGFAIERKLGTGAYEVVAKTAPGATSFTDQNLKGETGYSYRVRLAGGTGVPSYSNEVRITTLLAAPDAPADLLIRAVSAKKLELRWRDHSTNEAEFEVERKKGDKFEVIGRVGRDLTTFADENLTPNTQYVYRIVAKNSGGPSGYSNEASGTTLLDGPPAPSLLLVSGVTRTRVRLDWADGATDEQEILLERKTGTNGTYAQIAALEPDTTTYIDTGLTPGTTYVYRVRTRSELGMSANSNEARIALSKTLPGVWSGEPEDSLNSLRAAPNRVKLNPGQKTQITYHFKYGAYAVKLLARWTRYLTADGKGVRSVGPLEASNDLPATGAYSQKLELSLGSDVISRVRKEGQTAAIVRSYFEGIRADGKRVVWSTSVTVDLGDEPLPESAPYMRPDPKINAPDGAEMLYIGTGGLRMGLDEGTPEAQPAHPVMLSQAFWMYKNEVTNAQYRKFLDATGHREPLFWEDPRYNAPEQPVVGVSCDDAAAYAKWAGGRLPTEAEWEYVARGRDGRRFPWGSQDADPLRAVFATDRPMPVGQRSTGVSINGMLDMAGNVAEWCSDWFAADYYAKSPVKDPSGPGRGTERSVRGGAWNDTAEMLESGRRRGLAADQRVNFVGFRVVWQEPKAAPKPVAKTEPKAGATQ